MPSRPVRVALLFPTTWLGSYWESLLDQLTQRCTARLFTGDPWDGLEERGHPHARIVGSTTRLLAQDPDAEGYGGGLLIPSPKIATELLSFRPDVVFSVGFSLWTVAALLLAPLGRWRVVIVWEGSTPRVDLRESPVRTTYRKVVAKRAAAVVTNSRAGVEYLVDFLGIPAAKVRRRPYQLPTIAGLGATTAQRRDHDASAPLQLLSVGKLVPRKGLDLLFDALALLESRGVDGWRLQVVGTGEQEEALRRRAEDAGFGDQVDWAGWVAYDELSTHFAAADVFVFTTLEDTWGMVVLEAMAMGLPAVSSVWAGASDLVVEGGAGFVCDPHDVAALADHIQALVDDPEEMLRMGRAAVAVMADNGPQHAAAFFTDVAEEFSRGITA